MVDLFFFLIYFTIYHENIHILQFNKEKYKFIIMYKIITLTGKGKCTNYIKGVQVYIFHKI